MTLKTGQHWFCFSSSRGHKWKLLTRVRKVRSYKSIGKNEKSISLNNVKEIALKKYILKLGGKIQAGRGSYRFLCLLSINLKISNAILHVGLHQQILHLYLFFWVFLINLFCFVLFFSIKEAIGRQRVNPLHPFHLYLGCHSQYDANQMLV